MDNRDDKLKFWELLSFRAWAIIGICIVLLGILKICDIIALGIITIVITAVIVFSCHGLVNKFEQMRIPRLWGTLLTFLIGLIAVCLLLLLVVPAIASQATTFAEQMPYYFNKLSNWTRTYIVGDGMLITMDQFYALSAKVTEWVTSNASNLISQAGTGALGLGVSVGNAGLVLFIAIIASLWILIDLPKISIELRKLFSDSQQATISLITRSFGDAFYGWGKATFICAVLNGVVCGVCFFIGGVPYSSILGVICGVFYIVPYIGPVIFYVVCGVVGLTKSVWCCLLTILINFVVHSIVTNVVSPKLMKSSVNVHPAVVLIAIVIGEGVAGVLGMLLAVPLVAALQTIFVTYYEARTGKELYTEDGALFQKVKQKPLVPDAFENAAHHKTKKSRDE